MMPQPLRAMLRAAQTPSGAFASQAQLPGGPVEDDNAFATALVLDLLADTPCDPEIARLCERASAFLLRCQRAGGGFAFYPADAQPAWIRESLPPDADDTALIAVTLWRTGAWRRDALADLVQSTLQRHRLPRQPPGAPWFRAGVYPTWLDATRLRNPIDLCVNVNVAVLIHLSGAGSASACDGILEMVEAGLDWAGGDETKARALAPYYPQPAELGHALARAARAGVPRADALLARWRALPFSRGEADAQTPICGSLGAGVVWTSPVLQALRQWARPQDPRPAATPAPTSPTPAPSCSRCAAPSPRA